MITDKDIEEARKLGSIAAHCFNYRTNSFQVGEFNKQASEFISRIRIESAEQALKEAANRAVIFYQQDCEGCGEKCGECIHTRQLRSAILNKPEVKE